MQHLKLYSKQDVLSLTLVKKFETRVGERVQTLPETFGGTLTDTLTPAHARYVVIGIPESIGIRANHSTAVADTWWVSFLQYFVNLQSNDFFDGSDVLVLGHFDFGDIQYLIDINAKGTEEKLAAYRHAVQTVNEEVEEVIKQITAAGKIPIILGGGHNNTYPLIKGAAKGWFKSGKLALAQINCINMDAHSRYHAMEGHHSGNPIRYAEEDGYLQRYCVVGMQEKQLPQNVWNDMVNNPFMDCVTFEDIFINEKRSFIQAVDHATEFTTDTLTGIDVDLDSIQTNAGNTGIYANHARRFVAYSAMVSQPAYLFICGTIPQQQGTLDTNGPASLAAYLVADFVQARNELKNENK
jgi:formiminoglutamase